MDDFSERFRTLADNPATLRGLTEALAGGVVPYVGPGPNNELGLPSFSSFVVEQLRRVELPVQGDSQRDYRTLCEKMGELYVNDQLIVEFGNDKLPSQIRGSITLIPYLTHDIVLTTTISRSLEAAFAQTLTPFASVLWNDNHMADVGSAPRPTLVKLTGDVYDAPARHVGTEANLARREAWRVSLADILGLRPLLFIGAKLLHAGTRVLTPTAPATRQDHYALIPIGQRKPELLRALYPRRIRPVWYPDEPDGLSRALAYLIFQRPHPVLGVPPAELGTLEGPIAVVDTAVPDDNHLPPPRVPTELIDACVRRECVAFVGSGLGARAGLPTWVEFVDGMLNEAVKAQVLSPARATLQRLALHDGEVNAVADNVASALSSKQDRLIEYCRRVSTTTQPLPVAFETLSDIPFAGVLTSNYDDLLDRAYANHDVERGLTPADSERLLELLSTRERPFVVKLYGDLRRPDTLLLAPSDYQALVRSNAAFARFVESIFFSHTLLFVGVSLDGLTDYLSAFTFPSGIPRRHYALIAVSGKRWAATAELLQRRYNITVIPFAESPTFPEVDVFLTELRSSVTSAQAAAAAREATAVAPDTSPALRRVTLTDIGPFKHLELDFTTQRKVLLGDNGVGKSSILRAIAVAIVGSDARHSAARLIRAGQTSGSIRLETAKNPSGFITEIQRVGSGADIVSYGGRPLEVENWLALGFPPLRTASSNPLKGPQGMMTRRPSADDLLPLITGDIDVRLDDLKQWLVNNEAIVANHALPAEERSRAAALKSRFFEIVRALTDDPVLDLAEITTDYKVFVKTRDGNVPIELLSQGMSSLLSWIGILVQRLYEVHYGNANVSDPLKEYALVLMDEIDAHMHPRWQQQLMERLKTLFPRLQVIASTHSPLVVAGLPAQQVVRFVRQGDEIVTMPIDADMTLGRADQILTGDLFGLESTLALGDETNALLNEYETLAANARRDAAQQARYNELVRIIGPQLPSATAENKLERRTHKLVQTIVTADYSPEKLDELRRRLIEATRDVAQSLGLERPQ